MSHLSQPGSTAEQTLWWAYPLNCPSRCGETAKDWLRQGRQLYMSDGPASAEVIGRNIIGRVVGVYLGAA